MIVSVKHLDLKAIYEEGWPAKSVAGHKAVLTRILSALDQATQPGEMDLPGFGLRELKGSLKGHYAVSVSEGRWVTFRFENGQVADVDLPDIPRGYGPWR